MIHLIISEQLPKMQIRPPVCVSNYLKCLILSIDVQPLQVQTFLYQNVSSRLFIFCLLVAQRYKTLHKYEYQYDAESLNAINGGSQLKNGPRASCLVRQISHHNAFHLIYLRD